MPGNVAVTLSSRFTLLKTSGGFVRRFIIEGWTLRHVAVNKSITLGLCKQLRELTWLKKLYLWCHHPGYWLTLRRHQGPFGEKLVCLLFLHLYQLSLGVTHKKIIHLPTWTGSSSAWGFFSAFSAAGFSAAAFSFFCFLSTLAFSPAGFSTSAAGGAGAAVSSIGAEPTKISSYYLNLKLLGPSQGYKFQFSRG